MNPRLLPAKSWSASDDPPKVDIRAGGENILTEQNALLLLQTTSAAEFEKECVSQTLACVFSPQWCGSLLCAWRSTDILDTLYLTHCEKQRKDETQFWLQILANGFSWNPSPLPPSLDRPTFRSF